jgi:ABC-type nitrate/sulfonate/bicarbonate transport system ATPase subunit
MEVKVTNLHFRYKKDKPVLNGISFDTKQGEILGILGSSGCGKSTLLRIICGLIVKTPLNFFSGSVKFNGNKESEYLRRKGLIGFMFQNRSLFPNLRLDENIILPTKMNKSLNSYREFADELINMVGLHNYIDYLPKELSGGMQTRAELARAFITKPRILLLDEPFSSLDFGWKMDLYPMVLSLIRKFETTTIIVSHDINEVVLLADRVIIISKDGTITNNEIVPNKKPVGFNQFSMSEYLEINSNVIGEIQSVFLNTNSLSI